MPNDVTIFAASYLVFIDAVLCIGILVLTLYGKPRLVLLKWAIATLIALVLSYGLAKLGAALYSDPRPFTQDHVKPLIAHAADNGFPSDHALLAAALVAILVVAGTRWAVVAAAIAILVDCARVGAGIHHVVDVLVSTLFVALALLIALLVAGPIANRVDSLLPRRSDRTKIVGGAERGPSAG
jgi:membrane-associated phospholipid phosphatase